jgi:hypothetical protein
VAKTRAQSHFSPSVENYLTASNVCMGHVRFMHESESFEDLFGEVLKRFFR